MSALFALLDRLGVPTETHEHPPVFTIEEARAHWAVIDAAHTKNLLLKDAGGIYWLLVMPAEMALDLKALPGRIGSKRLRFAPADDLDRLLGVQSGALSAFALLNDSAHQVRLVIDEGLLGAERIALHPLDNCRTTVIAPAGLRAFLKEIVREATVVQLG